MFARSEPLRKRGREDGVYVSGAGADGDPAALAPVLVMGLVGVVVAGMFLGLDPVYPFEGPTGATRGFWSVVAGAGALAAAAALRPGVRR